MRSYYKTASYYDKDRDEGCATVAHAHNVARSVHGWDNVGEKEAEKQGGFFTHDYLCHGDYCGAGALGRANVKCLREEYGALEGIVWETYLAGHGFEGVIIDARYRDRDAFPVDGGFMTRELELGNGDDMAREAWRDLITSFAECIDALDDYPCIDDQSVSEQKQEEENEAWELDGYRDLARAVRKAWQGEDYEGWADDFDSGHAKRLVSDVVHGNQTGEECTHEQGGAWIDVEYVMKQHVTEEAAREAYLAEEEARAARSA